METSQSSSQGNEAASAALAAEGEEQLLKPPPECITYSSFDEMRRELFEFVKTQGYRIRIRRSVQKVSKVTGQPLEKRRFVWECDRAGGNTEARKSGCPFSFSAVEIQIGTDRWEIKYPKKASQHIHNHGPRDGPVARPGRGEQIS
jgi:hypothetical protein